MGATEVLKILNKGEPLTALEISERINCSSDATKVVIKRLLKDVSENIKFRDLTPEEKKQRYGRNIGVSVRIFWL